MNESGEERAAVPEAWQSAPLLVERRLEEALAELDAIGAALPGARLALAINALRDWRPPVQATIGVEEK